MGHPFLGAGGPLPGLFTWFAGPWTTGALATIMLGMGLTLRTADFRRVWEMPRPVALGFIGQYTIMPATAWLIASAMNLDTPFAVGLIGFLLHLFGFILGYAITRMFRFSQNTARTVSIEVGMQNSGLAMVLANQHFAPATAAPAVFSSIFHTLVGSLCAAYWRLRRPTDEPAELPPARRGIYYWKCDRPAAFHGTGERGSLAAYEAPLAAVLRDHFACPSVSLHPAGGQGNHITWRTAARSARWASPCSPSTPIWPSSERVSWRCWRSARNVATGKL